MLNHDYIDDSMWPEVEKINGYAVFIGYLVMGVRGLGLLVVTWITAVLLGGFVSVLGKKDFWSLTVITLVQTAGVFDFLLKEKSRDVVNSWWGLLAGMFATMFRPFRKEDKRTSVSSKTSEENPSAARIMVTIGLLVVQHLVFAIVLCPLVVLYLLGLYISAVISLCRLIQHDYGDGGANLEPALNVLYALAVAQGLVFSYKAIFEWAVRTRLAEEVVGYYQKSLDDSTIDLVSEYLDETVTGCRKDSSFANGRNLATYGVGLLTEFGGNFFSGVRIVSMISDNRHDQAYVIENLLSSRPASFNQVIMRLLHLLGCEELGEHAARIVALLAGTIRLEQLPGGILYIAALLEPPRFYYKKQPGKWLPNAYDEDCLLDKYERVNLPLGGRGRYRVDNISDSDYNRLMLQGLGILRRLAKDEGNCRVICSTEGLVSSAMAPLIFSGLQSRKILSEQLHRDSHGEWSSMAREMLELLSRLIMATTPEGETRRKLQHEISTNMEALVSTLNSIQGCLQCEVLLKRQALEMLLYLSVDTSYMMATGSSTRIVLISVLLDIFLLRDVHFADKIPAVADKIPAGNIVIHWAKKRSGIRSLVAHELQAAMMPSFKTETGATNSMLQTVVLTLGELSRAILDAKNNTQGLHAARILGHMCRHYMKVDEYQKELKKAMLDLMPKVLEEILPASGSARDESNIQVSSAPSSDLEKGLVSLSQGGDVQENTATSHEQQNCEQHEGWERREALISLCLACANYQWRDDKDFNRQVKEIITKIYSERGMHAGTGLSSFVYLAEQKLREEKTGYVEVQTIDNGNDTGWRRRRRAPMACCASDCCL